MDETAAKTSKSLEHSVVPILHEMAYDNDCMCNVMHAAEVPCVACRARAVLERIEDGYYDNV